MARPLRIQYEGAVYHVTCRGNEQRRIYRDDEDRKRFLNILGQSLEIYSVNLFCYVLMDNHFHLLLETLRGNLGEFMRHFNISYTGDFNRKHGRVGHLYQGRYKSIIVEREGYLSILSRYIHLNPVRVKAMAGQTDKGKIEYLCRYRWSSLPGYLDVRRKESFLDYAMVLAEYGGDTANARKLYQGQLYAELAAGLEIKDKIVGQSVIGGDEFVAWVRETFLKGKKDRELPSMALINRKYSKDEILAVIRGETGKDVDALKAEKGDLRRIAMELLYRHGGVQGPEIGGIFGLDYSSVSQERKRLRERLQRDSTLRGLMNKVIDKLSTSKI